MANTKKIAGYLVVLEPESIRGNKPLFYGSNTIGRSEHKASLILKEISVSQKHATLYVT